jgi:hypothetical protein
LKGIFSKGEEEGGSWRKGREATYLRAICLHQHCECIRRTGGREERRKKGRRKESGEDRDEGGKEPRILLFSDPAKGPHKTQSHPPYSLFDPTGGGFSVSEPPRWKSERGTGCRFEGKSSFLFFLPSSTGTPYSLPIPFSSALLFRPFLPLIPTLRLCPLYFPKQKALIYYKVQKPPSSRTSTKLKNYSRGDTMKHKI